MASVDTYSVFACLVVRHIPDYSPTTVSAFAHLSAWRAKICDDIIIVTATCKYLGGTETPACLNQDWFPFISIAVCRYLCHKRCEPKVGFDYLQHFISEVLQCHDLLCDAWCHCCTCWLSNCNVDEIGEHKQWVCLGYRPFLGPWPEYWSWMNMCYLSSYTPGGSSVWHVYRFLSSCLRQAVTWTFSIPCKMPVICLHMLAVEFMSQFVALEWCKVNVTTGYRLPCCGGEQQMMFPPNKVLSRKPSLICQVLGISW